MSGSERLREIVSKLAREAPEYHEGWRAVDTLGAPLSAFLGEIDEIMLPRRVSLRNARGDVLTVDIGNRRLMQIAGPVPAGLEFLPVDEALSPEDEAQVGALKSAMGQFLGTGDRFWVKTGLGPGVPGAGRTGLSAAILAKAWGVAPGPRRATPDEALAAFAAALEPLAVVWVHLDGGTITAVSEGEPAAAWSRACAGVDWAARLPDPDGDGLRLGLFAGESDSDAGCLLAAAAGTRAVCALLPRTRLDAALAAWRRARVG